MRLIDADALLNTLKELLDEKEKEAMFAGNIGFHVGYDEIIYHIKNASTITLPEPYEEGKA